MSDVVGFDEGQDKQGPLVLAVASTRTHPSDSDSEDPPAEIPTDDPIPAEASNPEDIASPGDTGASDDEEEGKEPERETRIVLVGDSDFVANRYLEGVGGNLDLFLNMLSWLAKDEDLIAVRPRDPTDRQVTLTERDSNMLFWSTVISAAAGHSNDGSECLVSPPLRGRRMKKVGILFALFAGLALFVYFL